MLDKLLLTEHLISASPIDGPDGSGQVAARSGLLGADNSPTCGTLSSSLPMPSLLHKKVLELVLIVWALEPAW